MSGQGPACSQATSSALNLVCARSRPQTPYCRARSRSQASEAKTSASDTVRPQALLSSESEKACLSHRGHASAVLIPSAIPLRDVGFTVLSEVLRDPMQVSLLPSGASVLRGTG